jgi:death-on-curing protein
VSEPIFLTLDEILRLHARSLAEHGGTEGVRDQGLVESAIGAAKNAFFYGDGDLFDVAAGYAFHLAEAQAFLDGNKRTAVTAALVFLARNGAYVQPAQLELYFAMIQIAEKKLSKTGLAAIFRKLSKRND